MNSSFCTLCGDTYTGQTHVCSWNSTKRRLPVGPPATTLPIRKPKDVNWHTYVPANPPEGGCYLVVSINPETKHRAISFSTFNAEQLTWSLKDIVTHYAKADYPE